MYFFHSSLLQVVVKVCVVATGWLFRFYGSAPLMKALKKTKLHNQPAAEKVTREKYNICFEGRACCREDTCEMLIVGSCAAWQPAPLLRRRRCRDG